MMHMSIQVQDHDLSNVIFFPEKSLSQVKSEIANLQEVFSRALAVYAESGVYQDAQIILALQSRLDALDEFLSHLE